MCARTSSPRGSRRSAALFAPLFAPLAGLAGRIGGPPSAAQRKKWRWTVVAEARSGTSVGRATLSGADVYGLTASLVAHAAEALRAGEARGAGTLAPAEAFDVHTFLPRLAPFVTLEGVEIVRPRD